MMSIRMEHPLCVLHDADMSFPEHEISSPKGAEFWPNWLAQLGFHHVRVARRSATGAYLRS